MYGEARGPALQEPPPATCPDCGGSGWKLAADGGAGTASRCDCHKRQRGEQLLQQAAIPQRYRHCRLDNFKENPDKDGQMNCLQAWKISERYVEDFYSPEDETYTSSGLIFTGPPGVGKTHLAVAVLHELISRYKVRGRFVEFTVFLSQLRDSFDDDSPETKRQLLAPLARADVLVLDELGAQKPTEWVRETLYEVINGRYTQNKPTIFTTNYPLRSTALSETDRFGLLSTRISQLLVSRIFEMARIVTLTGADYRRHIDSRQAHGRPDH